MRYLKRKFDDWLEQWLANPNRKPLLVKGARQVGKTESIRHFAQRHYKSVIGILTLPHWSAFLLKRLLSTGVAQGG